MTDVDKKSAALRQAMVELWDVLREEVDTPEDNKEHRETVFDYIIDAEQAKVLAGIRE
jgi:hypothetical protein